jgi:hypothetical protein
MTYGGRMTLPLVMRRSRKISVFVERRLFLVVEPENAGRAEAFEPPESFEFALPENSVLKE